MRLYLDTSVFGALFDLEPPGRIERTKMFFRATERHSVNVRLGYPQIDIISPEEALYE